MDKDVHVACINSIEEDLVLKTPWGITLCTPLFDCPIVCFIITYDTNTVFF